MRLFYELKSLSFVYVFFIADQLFCGAGKCIAVEHICNGVSDCEWGQDERNCGKLIININYSVISHYEK